MPDVLGIRFKSCGKIYDFEVNGIEAKAGDYVVVESDFGLSLGKVIRESHFIDKSERELKKVLRIATDDDFRARDENKKLEKEARDFCLERIMARGLPMKLVGTETTLDRKRIVFYFTAEGRIDFRELVKDLAARFKTRIEMRQIGVRDEAKLIGGFGVCGRPICCKTFLTSFDPVSIKMAKKQEMALNIGKLSGLCGRLMCCLRYEYDGDLTAISTDEDMPLQSESPLITDVLPVEDYENKPETLSEAKETEETEDQEDELETTDEYSDDDESESELEPEVEAIVEAEPDSNEGKQERGEAQRKESGKRKSRRRFKRRRFRKNDQSKKVGTDEK